MRSLGLAAAVVGLASARPASAQTQITEAEFVDHVTAEHPALRVLGDDLAVAQASRRRAGLFVNPRLAFEREHPEGHPRQDTWSVTWTPPLPGKYVVGRRAAHAALTAERLRLDAERLRVRQEARRVYADWSLAEARHLVVAAQSEQLSLLAEKARLRAESGEESGLSARRLRLAAIAVRAELATAEAERARAAAEVRAWQPDFSGEGRPRLPVLPEGPVAPGQEKTLELRALEADVEHARLTRSLSGRFWEAPELRIGRQTLTDLGPTRGGAVWGVSWSVPLFDRGQPERALARRRAEMAEGRLELATRRAQAQLEAAVTSYRALRAGVREIEPEVEGSARVVEAAIASYRAGENSVTDLLDTLEGVRTASRRWLELYAEAHSAHRALELLLAPVRIGAQAAPSDAGGASQGLGQPEGERK